MPPEILKLAELGGTVLIAVVAMWVILQLEKRKNPLNGSTKDIIKELQLLNTNHLHDICARMDNGNDRTVEAIREVSSGQRQMIELLGEINGKLNK